MSARRAASAQRLGALDVASFRDDMCPRVRESPGRVGPTLSLRLTRRVVVADDARLSAGAVHSVSGVALPTSTSEKVLRALVSVPRVTNWVMG